jgi:chromosome segregation ATPase
LEVAAERQNEFLKTKVEEREALEIKLAQAERQLEEQLAQVQQAQETICQLQSELAATDSKLGDTEAQVREIEQRRAEITREKDTKDLEIIDQSRRLKQLDVELCTRDAELKEQSQAFDTMVSFSERMLRQLEMFEAENREVARMVSNTADIQAAVEKFDGIIADSKDFLATL